MADFQTETLLYTLANTKRNRITEAEPESTEITEAEPESTEITEAKPELTESLVGTEENSTDNLKLSVTYYTTFSKTNGLDTNDTPKWYVSESGQSGSNDCYYTELSQSTLSGYNIKDIKLRLTSDGFLELAYNGENEVPKSQKYSVVSNLNLSGIGVPKTTTYTNENLTYQFGSESLHIHFFKMEYKFTCGGNYCNNQKNFGNGYVYCYFSQSPDFTITSYEPCDSNCCT